MPLTDVRIRQAKADSKPAKLTDANGLYIEIKPTGAKLWRYRYKLAGRENVYAIGAYPEISLQDARKARDEARVLVKKGQHPAHARLDTKLKTMAEGKQTFRAIADEWLGKKAIRWTEKHRIEISRMLEANAYPYIGALPVRSITTDQILTLVENVERRGSPSVAIKLRTYTSSIFRYAMITRRADWDPASALIHVVVKPPTETARPLTRAELIAIFRALPRYQQRRTAIAVKLLMMLFTRTIELCRAEWHEIDLNTNEWRIPPEKIKSRRLHIVPLSTQANELLRELHGMTGGHGYVLPIMHSNRKLPHMSRATINQALIYLLPNHPVKITGHDFRATASTYLHEQNWRSEVIEMQLSHKDKDKTRASYNHAKYLEERRKMMQSWSDWLSAIEEEALAENVEQRTA